MRLSDFNPPMDGSDATAAVQAALDAAQGGTLEFDVSGRLCVNRIKPRDGTTIVLHSGVTLAKAPNTAGVLYMQDCTGVRIIGNGATIDGTDYVPTSAKGHTVYALGTVDCSISGLTITGATDAKDCLYIGLGTQPNQRLRVSDCRFLHARRNGVSVVAGIDTTIEDCEAAYSVGAPGAGIDIEANKYGHVSGTILRRVRAHHNGNAGILSIFGVGTRVEDCHAHDNGTYGFAASSGGYQFAEGVYRPNVDVIGVSGFDPATGVIFVGAQPPVGTPINFWLLNGATKPAELSSTYYIVSRHVGSDGIILGRSVRNGEVTSFASSGSGVMHADPTQSSVRLRAFVDGQSDRLEVIGGRYCNNVAQGIYISGAGRFRVQGSEVRDNGGNQVQVSYTRDGELDRLQVSGGPRMGISASSGGGRLVISNCHVERTAWRGISVSEWTGAELDRNSVYDCGATDTSSAKAGIHASAILRPTITKNRVSQPAANTTTLFGIYAEGTAINGAVTGNDMTGAGTTPTNALRVMSATCVVSGNIGRDGVPL